MKVTECIDRNDEIDEMKSLHVDREVTIPARVAYLTNFSHPAQSDHLSHRPAYYPSIFAKLPKQHGTLGM